MMSGLVSASAASSASRVSTRSATTSSPPLRISRSSSSASTAVSSNISTLIGSFMAHFMTAAALLGGRMVHFGPIPARMRHHGGKAFGVDGLHEIAVRAEVIAFLNVPRFLRRREHDDGNYTRRLVALEPPQHVEAVQARHLHVEQDQARMPAVAAQPWALAQDEVERVDAVAHANHAALTGHAPKCAVHEIGIRVAVFDQQNVDRRVHS